MGKIYTGQGDDGYARLRSGRRLPKCDLRFEVLGDLDELNCLLGWCRAGCDDWPELRETLKAVQARLMAISAEVADDTDRPARCLSYRTGPEDVRWLEQQIDETLKTLRLPADLVLPDGTELACRLQIARAVCRRAERSLVRLHLQANLSLEGALAFVNRLSDALFVWALEADRKAGRDEDIWKQRP